MFLILMTLQSEIKAVMGKLGFVAFLSEIWIIASPSFSDRDMHTWEDNTWEDNFSLSFIASLVY